MNSHTTTIIIDEFGRDISLRRQTETVDTFTALLEKFKSMSWADISWAIEEEEERVAEIQEKERAKEIETIVKERKELLSKGKYDLEEGEILE